MPRVVDWGTKPGTKKKTAAAANLDSLVTGPKKRTKRLNAEIPAELHTRIKTQCAADGKDIIVPEIPGPPQAIASTAILPAFLLLLIIRRGLLARAPLIGRYLRAYRRAALKYQIDVAEKRLHRLESMDRKQRAEADTTP